MKVGLHCVLRKPLHIVKKNSYSDRDILKIRIIKILEWDLIEILLEAVLVFREQYVVVCEVEERSTRLKKSKIYKHVNEVQ